MTVLFLGESLPEEHAQRGASAFRLLRIDYEARTVRVLALPPDLWVRTPTLSGLGIEATTLGATYQEALKLGEGSERAKMAHASDLVARTLADNFRLLADHTVSIRQGTFVDAIDAMGGLEIDLPEDVDGTSSGLGRYRAGRQVLDGQATLDYFSIYAAAGDTGPAEWARTARQNQVLQALRAQVTRPQTLLRLPALVRRFHQDVVTDLGLSEVVVLACLAQEADVSIEHVALPPDLVTPGEGKVLMPKTDEVSVYLATALAQ
jgi:anionic cell wall polymer biosynthesis LytR-Cps2A-Psr (LCP) family protein